MKKNWALLGTILLFSLSQSAVSQINVNTSGSASINYPLFSQSAGPFPWTDIGIKVGANVSSGSLNATVGGSTAFGLNTTLTNNQAFIPGSTVLDLGYNPAWTGSVSTNSNGNLNAALSYGIGPISGSVPIMNVNLNTSANGSLGFNLNSGTSGSAHGGVSSPTYSLNGTLEAPFDIARVTLSLGAAAHLDQNVSWSPTVTYGDWVWYSTTPTYSAADNPTFIAGSGGHVLDTFGNPPPSLGLSAGDTFYMNILPAVDLSLDLGNGAEISVPVNLDVNGQVFGDGFNYNFPLGNLYDLSTGTDTTTVDGTWYGSEFYSIPLTFDSSCPLPGVPCESSYIGPTGTNPGDGTTGIPDNLLPPPTINLPSWPDGATGPGTTPIGTLFPNGNCSPFNGSECFNTLTFTPTPEPESLLLLLSGLAGAWKIVSAKRKR